MPEKIYTLAKRLHDRLGTREVLAGEYGLEPADEVVFRSLDLPDRKNRRLSINIATEFGLKADPPFEWRLELFYPETAEHYLWLADGRAVRAERKEFFEVTDGELLKIETDLQGFSKS